MNGASESLLSAVDILIGEAVSKLEYDKTIQAEVYKIVNLDTGEYKVKYSGNIFSAFANDAKTKYKVGENVYVTVPEGNFSNKKIINSRVNSQSLSYGEMIELTNSIMATSPSFDTLYNTDWSAAVGVVAGASQESELGHKMIYEGSLSSYNGLFLQYSRANNLIRIKASFMTFFHCKHTKGNYGIEVEFFTKGDDTVSYKLDVSAFNGDPYALSVYSPQLVVITAQPGFLTGIKSIKLFQENFDYDRYVNYGVVTDKENLTAPNIFVKDIELSFVEQKNLTDNLYHLSIATPRGNSFTDTITALDLVAKLYYEGENILYEGSCECKWFERDLSILVGSNSYDKNAGVGWIPVTSTVYDTMTLLAEDVKYQKLYKLVVIYNDTVILTDEVTVFNLESAYDFELHQETVGDEILLQIVNNKTSEVLLGDWYLSYPDGSYSSLDYNKNTVVVTDHLLYSSVVFYCAVYAADEVIGVLEHTIMSSDSESDIAISYVGEDQFRYDANGDVAIEDAEKERTLQVSLAWKEGTGTSYNVEWIAPDGEEITNSRQNPVQSMIENLWVDNSNILHYTIRLKYKVNYNNNTITVKIITVDGKEYNFRKEILFLKDGDLGTNGTTYVTAIRPYDPATGLKISGLAPLIYRSRWINNLPLKCYVYKDGEFINNDSRYELSYKWTGVNITFGDNGDNIIARGLDQIISAPASPYVKVQVTVNDKMNNRKYDIYSSYPIDVSVGFTDDEIALLNIEDIPSYIKYTSSGVNPSFYSNNIEFLYDGVDYSAGVTSLTSNILAIDLDDGLYYLKPASSFISEIDNMALLKCLIGSKYLLHPVIMYLDTYGNEAINGWDGTKLDINEDGQYIFAPLIGAGAKDSANRFTGIVMGQDSGLKLIGLYGYQLGVNTFGLLENGTAYFGKAGDGRITLNGTNATIEGGGGGNSDNGMTITLANTDRTNSAIRVGKGKFEVKYDGSLVATAADITGIIKADTGYIGGKNGWTIAAYRLHSGTGNKWVELNSNPDETYAIWCGSSSSTSAAQSKFAVSKDGKLYAKEGNIGGWTMTSRYLQDSNGTVGLASSGSAAFWAGSGLNADSSNIGNATSDAKFLVTRSGKLYCSSADISGRITADRGKIGSWNISNGSLYSGNTWLYSDGSIYCDDLTADGGYIGGWSIGKKYLMSDLTILSSTGYISSNEIQITQKSNGNYLGYLGLVEGEDDYGTTFNIGIQSGSNNSSIILSSARNIALRTNSSTGGLWVHTGSNGIRLNGDKLEVDVPKTALSGIYARFG